MVNGIGFGKECSKEENPYLGKWVILYPQGVGSVFCGRVKKIDGNYALLNPFYTNVYDEQKGKIFQKKVLIEGDLRVPLVNAAIEPRSKISLEKYVQLDNRKRKEDAIGK